MELRRTSSDKRSWTERGPATRGQRRDLDDSVQRRGEHLEGALRQPAGGLFTRLAAIPLFINTGRGDLHRDDEGRDRTRRVRGDGRAALRARLPLGLLFPVRAGSSLDHLRYR